jgi:hypothetical protein
MTQRSRLTEQIGGADHHDAGGSDSDGDQFDAAQVHFTSFLFSSALRCFALCCFSFEHCFVAFTTTPSFVF